MLSPTLFSVSFATTAVTATILEAIVVMIPLIHVRLNNQSPIVQSRPLVEIDLYRNYGLVLGM
jgi:hypothetical protein